MKRSPDFALLKKAPDSHPSPQALMSALGLGPTIVDVGCHGWLLAGCCQKAKGRYIGVDRALPPNKPAFAEFAVMKGERLEVIDDVADLTIARHVIEHLHQPVEFVAELGRVTRPGGVIFIEAPSEISTLTRSADNVEEHRFDSFWDDPTHVRPYTPAALYRLALSAGLQLRSIGRGMTGAIPVAYMTAIVPYEGKIESRYVTLENVPYGFRAAAAAIWPDRLALFGEH